MNLCELIFMELNVELQLTSHSQLTYIYMFAGFEMDFISNNISQTILTKFDMFDFRLAVISPYCPNLSKIKNRVTN